MLVQVEGEEESEGVTQLKLRLTGALKPGLIWLEVQSGIIMSAARPLLVLPKGKDALAAEVTRITSRYIAALHGSGECDRAAVSAAESQEEVAAAFTSTDCNCCEGFVADLGLVVSRVAAEEAVAEDGCCASLSAPGRNTNQVGLLPPRLSRICTCRSNAKAQLIVPWRVQNAAWVMLMRGCVQAAPSLITRTARHLLAFACDAGAPVLANYLLRSASAGCSSASEVVGAVNRTESQGGTTLLHRALRSGSVELIDGLLTWGHRNGYQWQVCLMLSL